MSAINHSGSAAHNPFLYNAGSHNGGLPADNYSKLSSDMYSDYSRLFGAAGQVGGGAAGDYSKLLAANAANDYSKLFAGHAGTPDYSKLLNSAAVSYNPFMQNPYMNPSAAAAAQLGMAGGGQGPHGGHQSAQIPGIAPTSY